MVPLSGRRGWREVAFLLRLSAYQARAPVPGAVEPRAFRHARPEVARTRPSRPDSTAGKARHAPANGARYWLVAVSEAGAEMIVV